MGNAGAASMGLKEAPTTVEECVNGILGKVSRLTSAGEGEAKLTDIRAAD